ncbi:hypothetical protein [Nocardioides terrisoli]|uniref:hypothetical protein n=1 Tax=Nocardioides terrisoli TaxID=3388267 RepID=UPI00287B7413|nr:hypothetical protein [Nocardioides marmorisolisilvae]
MTESPLPRVRITSPRTGRPRRTTVASEIDAQTEVGEVYMRSLMRTQLRLALGTVLLLVLTVGAWPVVFEVFPAVRRAHLAGLPLPWLLLGLLVYPVLLLLAWSYVRRAERNEQSFHDLVGPGAGDEP